MVMISQVVVLSGHLIENTSGFTSTNSVYNIDPSTLKGALSVNNDINSHRLILYSYSTDAGSHFTGLNYPSNVRLSLPTGSYIKVGSDNPNFKVLATEIALYRNGNDENLIYPQPAADGQWYINATPGVYHLRVNAEYTPSNDDVATFVDTVQVLGKSSVKDLNQAQSQTSSSSNSPSDDQATKKQQQQVAKAGSFKIIVQIIGVNKDNHDKMVFVTGNPSFNPIDFLQSRIINLDTSKAVVNSSYSTTFQLPKDYVKTGQKFMACMVSLQPLEVPQTREPIICKIGINTPANKPEIIIFSTSELTSDHVTK
jgi:hypothetical protein